VAGPGHARVAVDRRRARRVARLLLVPTHAPRLRGRPVTARRDATSSVLPGKASLAAAVLLCITLFLLSADQAHVLVAGNKVKYGYFCVVALWITRPHAMMQAAIDALHRVPRWPFLIVIPAAVAVATSADFGRSLSWALWLAFDAFTVL